MVNDLSIKQKLSDLIMDPALERLELNHREALDFIFENKPDRMSEVSSTFLMAIRETGHIPAASSKGYARFLTSSLDPIIPRSGNIGGFKEREQFLFELSYGSKSVTLKTVVAPRP